MTDGNQEDAIKHRYTFTLPPALVNQVDTVAQTLNTNRSHIAREALAQWLANQAHTDSVQGEGVAFVSFIYNHHEARLLSEIVHVQHDFEDLIVTTTHIHLNHDKCLEIVLCRGNLMKIKQLGSKLQVIKGINSFSQHFAIDQ